MTRRTIGLLIKKPESIFSNGCVQQSLFLKKTLEYTGATVHFLSVEPDYTTFEAGKDHYEITFTNSDTDFTDYDMIIMSSLVLVRNENNNPYIDNMLRYTHLKIVNFVCGNVYILHQEEFVFNVHHIIEHYQQDYTHLNWLMEMYDYQQDYLTMICDRPTKISPYVWDPDIIEHYVQSNKLNITTVDEIASEKINIIIFEPNMSIHKNALIPLLICESYEKQYPNRINRVYFFCGDKVSQHNQTTLSNFALHKNKKVEIHGRIIMPYVIDLIRKNNTHMNVVLSHTFMNRLNFLHLELMYFGIPIVHNCEPFRNNGMYFEDNQFYKAVDIIENTRLTFDAQEYRKRCSTIISHYASSNPNRVECYKQLIENTISHHSSSSLRDDPTTLPSPPVVQKTTTTTTASSNDDILLLDNRIPKTGSGKVYIVNSLTTSKVNELLANVCSPLDNVTFILTQGSSVPFNISKVYNVIQLEKIKSHSKIEIDINNKEHVKQLCPYNHISEIIYV